MAYPEDYPDDLTKAKQQGYLHKHMIVLVDPATGLPYPGGVPPGGAGAYVHPNHTGDVTSVGDGPQTIATGVVSNAKMTTMPSQTIKGRNTAGTGAVEDLTAAAARIVVHSAGSNFVNMVANPGFDDWVAGFLGWTESGTCSLMADNGGIAGTQYLSMTAGSNVTQNSFAHVEEGQLVEGVFYIRGSAAGTGNSRMVMYFYDEANGSAITNATIFPITTSWQRCVVLALVPVGRRKVRLRIEHVAGSTFPLLYVDASSLRRVTENIRTIAQANPDVSHTGNTTETTLATIPIPPIMGASGILRIIPLWTATNNANNKTLRIRFSGAAGTVFLDRPLTTNQVEQDFVMIRNLTTGSQIGNGPASIGIGHGNASAMATAAVDTTVATSVVISGQLAVGTDTITLKSYTVELMLPP